MTQKGAPLVRLNHGPVLLIVLHQLLDQNLMSNVCYLQNPKAWRDVLALYGKVREAAPLESLDRQVLVVGGVVARGVNDVFLVSIDLLQ